MKKKLILVLLLMLFLSVMLFMLSCGGGSSSGDGSSTTNIQVEGIDEPDIVKVTDDGYIFKVQSDGFTVSKAQDGYVNLINQTSVSNFTPKEIFINKNFLIVIGSPYSNEKNFNTSIYFYDINELINIEGAETLINSKENRATFFEANYYTARIYNDVLYLALSNSYSKDEIAFNDTFQGDKTIGKIKISAINSSGRMFTVAKLELNGFSEDYSAYTYEGSIKDLYCSPYAIYAIGYSGSNGFFLSCSSNYSTQITKISYHTLKVEADMKIPNNVKDRFSLYDNGKNVFAVSYGRESMLSSYNNKLELISSINFAHGETLYSVRYEESFCYVVTFKQVDPLFKIDISNPGNLKIIGELKIPGFSNYMQGFGTDRMIGIGYDDDIRWNNSSKKLKVSLFDTSKDQPEEINNIIFKNDTSSLAYSNPRAILCEVENNIFAFEVTQKEYNGKIIEQGIFVLGIEDGILIERAYISSSSLKDGKNESRKYFTRLTRINDYFYAISDGYIASFNLSDFSYIAACDTRIKKDTFTVSFEANNSTLNINVQEGEKVTRPKNIVKPGYTLEGWYLNFSLTVLYDFDSPVYENITLYAKWIENI